MSKGPKDHSMDFPLRENGEPWLDDAYVQGRRKAAEKGREHRAAAAEYMEAPLQQQQQTGGARSWLPEGLVRDEPYQAPPEGMTTRVPLKRAAIPAEPDAVDQRPVIHLKTSDESPSPRPEPKTIRLRHPDSPEYATEVTPRELSPAELRVKHDAKLIRARGEKVVAMVNEKVAAVLGSALEEQAVKAGIDLKKEWNFDSKNDVVVHDGEPRMVHITLTRYGSVEDDRELEVKEKQMKDAALEQMVAIGLRPNEAELKIEELAREASAVANIPYPTKWHEKGFENKVEPHLGDRQAGAVMLQQKVTIEIPEAELAQRLGMKNQLTFEKGNALVTANKEIFGDDGVPRGSR
jgi:hypothetical protein